jgi:hypothetical protein
MEAPHCFEDFLLVRVRNEPLVLPLPSNTKLKGGWEPKK